MPMPPALAAALAAKQGGSKKKKAFGKKPGNASEDALDGGRDDAMEAPLAKAAKMRLAQKAPVGKKKKGTVPPQFLK